MSLEDVRAIREKKRQRRRAQKQVGDVKVSHINKREIVDAYFYMTGACTITESQH